MYISNIDAIQILDSRGNPTIQVEVMLNDGSVGIFQVPSGASTGIHEALELRDGNKNLFHGKSVLKAINNVLEIRDKLYNQNFTQKSLDSKLIAIDGTENKEILGANAILGISIAFAKASAKYYNLPLYEYLYRLINNVNFNNKKQEALLNSNVNLFSNVINGGLHSGNKLNIQEFMLVPNFDTMQEKIRAISEIYQSLKEIIAKKYGKLSISVGDEGGFAPDISKPVEALDLLVQAIEESNYTGRVFLAIDAAASDFYDISSKKYEVEPGLKLNYKELTNYYNNLIENYPLICVEDSMAEDDFEGFAYYLKHAKKLKFNNFINNSKIALSLGDDLLVTNPKRITMAIEKKLCNSLLLKINQIGTLSESIDAALLAKSKSWQIVVSHRSGETTDDFIADLAVALNSSIKLGACARGERVAKFNRLLNIYK